VAGTNSLRDSSSRLTTRGLGSSTSFGYVPSMGTLRPKRVFAAPISGWFGSVPVPSAERNSARPGTGVSGPHPTVVPVVSKRFCRRSFTRMPIRENSASGFGR